MKIRKGDMWSAFDEADLFCITTNSTLRHDNSLVMGAGIAKQAKDRFPALPQMAGAAILKTFNPVMYGLIVSPRWKDGKKIALFQTKIHWQAIASLEVISMATQKLKEIAQANPTAKIHLNYPGIGLGALDPLHVATIIRVLPDNVSVWRYDHDLAEEGDA